MKRANCTECEHAFTSRNNRAVTCSSACSRKRRTRIAAEKLRKKMEHRPAAVCSVCGKQFPSRTDKPARFKFVTCSKSCREEQHRRNSRLTQKLKNELKPARAGSCAICGKPYVIPKGFKDSRTNTCSSECRKAQRAAAYRRHRIKPSYHKARRRHRATDKYRETNRIYQRKRVAKLRSDPNAYKAVRARVNEANRRRRTDKRVIYHKKCRVCLNRFDAWRRNVGCCSDECRRLWRNAYSAAKSREKVRRLKAKHPDCLVCGKPVRRRKGSPKTCSKACSKAYRRQYSRRQSKLPATYARRREHYHMHEDRCRAYSRTYRQMNLDKVKAKERIYKKSSRYKALSAARYRQRRALLEANPRLKAQVLARNRELAAEYRIRHRCKSREYGRLWARKKSARLGLERDIGLSLQALMLPGAIGKKNKQ